MAKFTAQEKIQSVKRYLDGTEGYKTIAKSIGVSHGVFHAWIQHYQYQGENAFKKQYTTYSVDDKLEVLTYMNEHGTSPCETAAIFSIHSPSTVYQWARLFDKHGVDALIPRKKGRSPMKKENSKLSEIKDPAPETIEALQAENERLRMELAYNKKVECLSSEQGKITKQDKAQVVYELRQEFPVKSLLRLAGIPRSTYYHYIKQLGRPDKDAEIKTLIKDIFRENKGRYGYRRICAELANRGMNVNHKKVYRLMKELGLKCLVRMKKYRSYKGEAGKVAQNVLNRNFKASKPNEKWVTDITEFNVFGEKLYLSPMLDLYNGEIITYTIGSRPTYSLVSDMLIKALKRKTKDDDLLIHSDQGWHYQMNKYYLVLKNNNITQSMSRKGNCYDNAVIENFFGILKSEFLYDQDFKSIEHFRKELKKYIHYYNHKRIKSKLKGKSPVQYRTLAQQAA
ncbi:IS3 family transposase [Metabacillus idriensis]|uniref:IS3 family transposase n=1 Tax=Metabacillus idriensis TaxID=324768 RepID=UPI003D2C15A9